MKVGVYLGDYQPTEGGAFTFQDEAVTALARLAGESAHEFVLIGRGAAGLEKLAGPKVAVMAVGRAPFWEAATMRLARSFSGLRRGKWLRSHLERTARAAGVQFLWFTTPRAVDIDLPYLAIVYDLQHRLQPWFPEVNEYGAWFSRESPYSRILPRAARIITGTQAGQKEIELFYGVPENRMRRLPHPTPRFALDAKPSDRAVLAKYNLPERFLFYPAQFWAHKNHANLLLGLARLREAHGVELPLVMVGADYGNRDYVESMARELNLPVAFPGFVSQEELVALYQHAYALAYMTLFGPENLPPLEAMALGCPVVASRVDGADEQLGDAALLVDPLSPEAIAAGIWRLHSEAGLREDLIARGKKRAARWTVDDFVRGVFGILDEFEPYRRTWR
ncbi:MAG: glycosyltransferase family 1 protein [Anaerolineae bacterium]|nr:MAG: glycosyltransferase family 1 protein [Anaerolineae bacterium]